MLSIVNYFDKQMILDILLILYIQCMYVRICHFLFAVKRKEDVGALDIDKQMVSGAMIY
jgi:hypothetical protein